MFRFISIISLILCLQIVFVPWIQAKLPKLPDTFKLSPKFHIDPVEDGKIVGGLEAKECQFPYQVSLRRLVSGRYRHFCGASIISESCFLTAAHCAFGRSPSELFVVAGSINLKDNASEPLTVSTVSVHPEYNAAKVYNDIAVLKLANPLILSDSIQPIKVPSIEDAVTDAGILATVSGWGTTSEGGQLSNILQFVEVNITTDQKCKSAYGEKEIINSMVCADNNDKGGKDSCQGDSGGPLVINGTQIGVVSWGYGCARPEYPGVYTEVSYFLKFLKEQGCIN